MSQPGRFVWYDLMTTDPEAAREFYTRLLGWGIETLEGAGDEPYPMWTREGRPLGGVMRLPADAVAQGASPHWLAYVAVDDTDAVARRTRELGGSVVVEPTDIPDIGRFTVLQDPQGATIAAYSSSSGEQETYDGPPRVGEFSWHELATPNPEAALRFYGEIFGWHETNANDMGEYGVYREYGCEGTEVPLGGAFTKPADTPGPPAFLLYLRVGDLDAALARVKELGGTVSSEPMEVPGGDTVAQCLDPQGAHFALHHHSEG